MKGLPYGISFETREMPGKIKAITVALDTVIMKETDSIRVDLCDHPLYPNLVKYVEANPIGGKGLAKS
jgi:hypothetical protein